MPQIQVHPNVEFSIHKAFDFASEENHENLTLEHFLWAALETPELQEMCRVMNVGAKTLQDEVKSYLVSNSVQGSENPRMTTGFQRVLNKATEVAVSSEHKVVNMWMVLLKLLEEPDSHARYFLEKNDITSLKVKSYAAHGQHAFQDSVTSEGSPPTDENVNQKPLQRFAVNLNERAENNKIDPLIGRAYEVQRTAQILARRRKNNPLLVGEPGVGKTAIAEGLAKLIVEGKAPEALSDKSIWSLNMGAMLAGTKYRGDFEQRIKDVLDEVQKDPNIILFIDEIHTLVGAGASGGNSMDASNIIKPALSSGDMRVIGATTFQEYREIFEKEKALDRRFQKVDVVEPSPSDTVAILKGLKKTLEDHHDLKFTTDALQAAVDLSIKYIPDRFLPDKAIDILDEAGAAEQLKPAKSRHRFIDRALIEETVSRVTRIPVSQVNQDERDSLKTLSQDLKSAVFGQDKAIETLAAAVCVAKAGLNDGDKPLGSFMFAGPTGVGKTEIARQLSKTLGIPLLRFDMSEYMESHSVARLIGAPPGYVGHDKGGLLTDEVYKNPHAVLLLDEIEKAHPDIQNVLLQVMDRGALTDANGRTVNFKNTFVILTTNAGAQAAAKSSIGFLKLDNASEGRKVLEASFAPEFRNRLDATVSFNSLGTDEIAKIVDKNVRLLETHLTGKNVTLDVTDDARAALAKEGFVPAMGARPMARVVNERLKKPLAEKLLFGDLANGGHAQVSFNNGEFEWTTTPAQVAEVKAPAKKRKKKTAVAV